MEYFILNIARLLRKSGIDVNSREIADCIRLIRLIGPENLTKYEFYNLLNTTLVKEPWGADYVLWLIELYLGPDLEIAGDRFGLFERGRAGHIPGEEGHGGSSGKQVPLQLLVQAVLKHEIDLIYAVINGMDLKLEVNQEDRENALALFQEQSGFTQAADYIDQLYHRQELTEEEYQAAKRVLEEWNNLIKDEIERQLARNMSEEHLLQEMQKRNPRTIAFLDSDDAHFSLISQEIQKIGRKLATRKGRRRKVGPRGPVNLNRSLKHALKTGGIPIDLIRMQRKPAKPDLWLLCDMSNSVSKFIYFMLLFVFATQQRYANIRSFLFVDRLVEATDLFQEHDWASSLRNLGKIRGYNVTGYSHYGSVLQQFADQHLPFLPQKTTVLILGDAKNNRNKLDGNEVLAAIKESAAALYWLNPLRKDQWDQGDCLMTQYQQNCTGAFSVSNVEELEQFLSSL
ncbi:VWA domain-containing protein [Dehalobacter sp. DCM]|uniref:VWA domain-containing protein n=1 Tax=Dehalobacter sp. DCM TaxID=2907827 RepID=UPI003081CFBD|nr:VWA domain-containing protein [Dehalobacter sp. DCM]